MTPVSNRWNSYDRQPLAVTSAIALLFLLPYTAIYNPIDSKELKPWRIIAAALLLLAPWLLKGRRFFPTVFIPPALFFSYLLFQPAFFVSDVTIADIQFLIAQLPVLALPLLLGSLASRSAPRILRCLEFSAIFACLYQYYQLAAFYAVGRDYAAIANDANQVGLVGFYRVILGAFGAPSFMGEAGQFAMFIGPVLLLLVVSKRLRCYSPYPVTAPLVITSMVLTISLGGTFQTLMFIGVSILLTIGGERGGALSKTIRAVLVIAVIAASAYLLFATTDIASAFLTQRWSEIVEHRSERQVGASVFMDLFWRNPVWGYGFMSYRNTPAQPSHFITLLADHGIAGVTLLLSCFIVPFIGLAADRNARMLSIPLAASAFHMFSAYGSFQWPGVWAMVGTCVGTAKFLRHTRGDSYLAAPL